MSQRAVATVALLRPSRDSLLLTGLFSVSLLLLAWMLVRWRQVVAWIHEAAPAPGWLQELLDESRRRAGIKGAVRLCVIEQAMSPAICGMFRPTICLPRALIERLSPEQLRPILLHELIHLRRGDVWVNCGQTLLQIAYWWHPLLWFANSRIRGVREEAVDDAVMLELGEETAVYAPTLLEVARLALRRPIATLGLVAILEFPGSLRQRIERLIEFRPPRRAGLTLASLCCILVFAAVAVPMGPAPDDATTSKPDPRIQAWLQETKSLYETSKGFEAKAKVLQVLAVSPDNKVAQYYLHLIQDSETRRKQQSEQTASQAKNPQTPTAATNVLYTRVFKLEPRVLEHNLYRVTRTSPGGTNRTAALLKDYFKSTGLDFAPPKAFFYSEREARLMVRASLEDLEAMGAGIGLLQTPPAQVNVRVKFVELPVKLAKEFWKGLTNNADRVAILTDPQSQVALKSLESKEGVKVLTQASVTTLSERQAQVQCVEDIAVVVPTNTPISTSALQPSLLVTNLAQVGSVIDIYPVVTTNGDAIQLTVSAATTEFLGYDDPGAFVPQADLDGKVLPLRAVSPLPHFRLVQTPARTATVWDGETLVLGPTEEIRANQIPVFGGDQPLVGRRTPQEPRDKVYIVFVTPTIIDPAGNRVHPGTEKPRSGAQLEGRR